MTKFYRTIISIYLSLFVVVFVLPIQPANSADNFVRKANYFIRWDLSSYQVQELSKWDLVVLDMEVQVNSAHLMKELRKLNPNIKILAYITTQEIKNDASSGVSKMRQKLEAGIYDQWYLHDLSGTKISYWPGTTMLNITDRSPTVAGKKFNDYLAEFVSKEILATGLWDGIFYDNTWEGVTWFTGNNIDMDLNSQPDTNIDKSWQNGMRELIRKTRSLSGQNIIIIGNAVNEVYRDDLNGIMIETFPPKDLGWAHAMQIYSYNENGGQTPKYLILNASTANTGKKNDYSTMRYGLSSALLGDAYFSFDYGDQDHSQLWWYDEYDVNLGSALSKAVSQKNYSTFKDDVWMRNFSNGISVVNATNYPQNVDLGNEYEKIQGKQDPYTNDGTITSNLVLSPRDGIVMMKSLQGTGESQIVNNLLFTNGDFLRFFDMNGNRVRNGFFVFDDNYSGGTAIYDGDLNGKTIKNEKIIIEDGFRIKIFNDTGGRTYYEYPYGFNSGNRINLVAGSLFGDPDKEIIYSSSGGGKIMVVNYYGKIMNYGFYPFGETNKTGFSLGIGNIDGGRRAEGILGFSVGTRNEVMIYNFRLDTLLKRFTVGWNAQDVRVASGDLNRDGKDEVIVALKYSDKTIIKTFDINGKKLSEFNVQTVFGANNIDVGALDVNFDGKDDIVFMSN